MKLVNKHHLIVKYLCNFLIFDMFMMLIAFPLAANFNLSAHMFFTIIGVIVTSAIIATILQEVVR